MGEVSMWEQFKETGRYKIPERGAPWTDFDEKGNIIPEIEDGSGSKNTTEKKGKMYAIKNSDSVPQSGVAYEDTGSSFVYFKGKEDSYFLDGKPIRAEEAEKLLRNHPALAEEDKKRFQKLKK